MHGYLAFLLGWLVGLTVLATTFTGLWWLSHQSFVVAVLGGTVLGGALLSGRLCRLAEGQISALRWQMLEALGETEELQIEYEEASSAHNSGVDA